MVDPSMNIKDIVPNALATVQEVDDTLAAVRKAIANMTGQMDFATVGGVKELKELSSSDQRWFLNLKSARRHAQCTEKGLLARRAALLRAANGTLEEVVSALKDAELVEGNPPKITLTAVAAKAQRWLRDITGIIPNLIKETENDDKQD